MDKKERERALKIEIQKERKNIFIYSRKVEKKSAMASLNLNYKNAAPLAER